MGFSIKDYKVVAQNRSHYVNSAYHAQFKLLDKWILDHTEDLYNILGDGNLILYGEWVFALHSINYVDLPDYFIAFDLYDISEQRFYSRTRLEKILEGTTISLIPCIKKGSFKVVTDIVDLVKTKSQFYDGPIEGVYVRRCNELWLEDRAKIVRNDFLTGNQHWTKNQLTVNKLKIKY
jgi:atypical dual specificity phosphatase